MLPLSVEAVRVSAPVATGSVKEAPASFSSEADTFPVAIVVVAIVVEAFTPVLSDVDPIDEDACVVGSVLALWVPEFAGCVVVALANVVGTEEALSEVASSVLVEATDPDVMGAESANLSWHASAQHAKL